MSTLKVLIIGGGFAGCSSAHMISQLENTEVTLVEKSGELGAGNRTNWFGGHPYTFGPRHFLTKNKKVYDYLNNLLPLRDCSDHEFITYVERDNRFYNYPINMSDIRNMPDSEIILDQIKNKKVDNPKNLKEYWMQSVGEVLFSKMIDQYNQKMWLVDDCSKIDTFSWSPKGVTIKEGAKAAWDDSISCYPYAESGYNEYFDISVKDTKVLLNTLVKIKEPLKKQVEINGETLNFDIIINTISPDFIFDFQYGELPFIGRDLLKIVFPSEHLFPGNTYFLYYANNEKFTRLVEYKKFTKHKSPTTLIGLEIPSKNGKHYPTPFKKDQEQAKKYINQFPEGFYTIGRAGSYLYGIDIDDCIYQSMIIFDEIKNKKITGGMTGEEYQFAKRF